MNDPWYIGERRPRLAVHKFSSCDGCQLALLNAGEALLQLAQVVDIVHFVEAGISDDTAEADLALVEGSISTPEDLERIEAIRARSRLLVPMGACATAGGLQALRNLADAAAWTRAVYPQPQYIASLATATPVAQHVKVDWELRGCPVTTAQVLELVRCLRLGIAPRPGEDKLCLDCKRAQKICVMVSRGETCLGPVTARGCGVLCPAARRGCYGCFGPAEAPNTTALADALIGAGETPRRVAQRFLQINSAAPAFAAEGERWRGKPGREQ